MKSECKYEVLKRLQSASWMRDAGWPDEEIAAHYQNDRDHRAAVKRIRRLREAPTVERIAQYQRGRARVPAPLTKE